MYNVLVVDDEPLPREFLRTMVPKLDPRYTVVGEASDGIEALQFIRRHKVDLMITDIRMPEMDGLELCKEVYLENPKIMITILSGHEEFHYVQQAMLYRTEEYILKPINKQSIQNMLQRVAARLDKRKSEETVLRGLLSLSNEAKRQVATRFLQALITQSHAEISSLYPMIHRLKIPIFEGEGVVLLLSLDEHSLFKKMIPPKDYSVFNYILNQVASELTSQYKMTWTLFDSFNQTSILISGTDTNLILKNAHDLFERIQSTMQSVTKLSVSGGIGCWIEDVFQLDVSYQSAIRSNHLRFQHGGGSLREDLNQDDTGVHDQIELVFESLRNAAIIPNAAEWASKELTSIVNSGNNEYNINAYNLGAFILNKLSYRERKNNKNFNIAWKLLSTLGNIREQDITTEVVKSVYRSVLTSLVKPSSELSSEEDTKNSTLIDQVLDFVKENYKEPISLSMIADKFDITPQYLSRLFHQQIGTPYIKYLTQFRMEQAVKLLTVIHDIKVNEVSEEVGYENVKHFLYVFKKHFGVTPSEYKSMNCK